MAEAGGWPRGKGEAKGEMVPGYEPGMDCGMVTNELGI